MGEEPGTLNCCHGEEPGTLKCCHGEEPGTLKCCYEGEAWALHASFLLCCMLEELSVVKLKGPSLLRSRK